MTNQLIQKPNRPSVVKPEVQIVHDSIILFERRLADGFNSLETQSGTKSFNGLKSEYDNLKKIFENSPIDNSIINVDRIKKLTSSLYLQGLKLLASALESIRQLGSTNAMDMELEVIELEKELGGCSEKLKPIVEERIEKSKKALQAVKGYKDRIDELLCEAGLCKDAIREIRLEIPELMSHRPKDEYDKIMHELNARVEYAQRVKAEYDKQGI